LMSIAEKVKNFAVIYLVGKWLVSVGKPPWPASSITCALLTNCCRTTMQTLTKFLISTQCMSYMMTAQQCSFIEISTSW
jgi:hypothetical protein